MSPSYYGTVISFIPKAFSVFTVNLSVCSFLEIITQFTYDSKTDNFCPIIYCIWFWRVFL